MSNFAAPLAPGRPRITPERLDFLNRLDAGHLDRLRALVDARRALKDYLRDPESCPNFGHAELLKLSARIRRERVERRLIAREIERSDLGIDW